MSKLKPKHGEPTRQELDRVIIGNQVAIMRALTTLPLAPAHQQDLQLRVHTLRHWWQHEYGETLAFSTALGDRPQGEER